MSRIENGKRLPTKPQLLQLAQLYKCDKHKVLVHWLSDKVVSEIKYEDFGLEALQVAEEKVLYGKPYSLFLNINRHSINFDSRRYNRKQRQNLTNWILTKILNETKDVFLIDIFAGTASVANRIATLPKIIINDITHANK